MPAPLYRALTIAGSDSSGGAGIQADLKTFAALGVYGTSAITAITAQNTLGVIAVEPLVADLVTAQIEAVAGDIELHATKTGMLATAAIVEAVAAAIDELDLPKVVVDPVLVATSGDPLLDEDGVQVMRAELLPRALVVTPNIPEAEVLSGYQIRSMEDIQEAAQTDSRSGTDAPSSSKAVTGNGDERRGRAVRRRSLPRIPDRRAFRSATCTARAARSRPRWRRTWRSGFRSNEAAERAQSYVAGAIRHAFAIGHGPRVLDHFWNARRLDS